jgi:hypothetical protein
MDPYTYGRVYLARMELEEARELMLQCERDRTDARMQMQTAQAKSESATLIIQGVLRRFPQLREEASAADLDWEIRVSEGPSTADAVLQILQVDEGQMFTVREMVAALDERGWLPQSDNPANAVRTALERLRAQDKGVQKGYSNNVIAYYFEEPPPPKASSGGYGFDEEPF